MRPECFQQLPSDVQAQLTTVGKSLLDAVPSKISSTFEGGRDAWGVSAFLLATAGVDPSTLDASMNKLLGLSVPHRQWSLRVAGALGRESDVGIIIALTATRDPRVRAVAAEQLAGILARGATASLASKDRVTFMIRDHGTLLTRFLAASLSASAKAGARADAIVIAALDSLSRSISADTRAYAAAAIAASC